MKTTDLKKRLLFQLLFVFLIPGKFFAATFTVINTANTGAGSLRQAVISANAGGAGPHIVNFTISGTITLTSELPAITNPTTFNGGGIIVSGGNTVAIWGSMSSNGSDIAIVFNSMNFTAANSTLRGGGVFEIRQGYRATFNDCNFYGNTCTGTGGAISYNILSAQIASMRPLICNRCSFYNNHSTSNAAGVYNNNGNATFTNCSFLNNTTTVAGAFGGAYSATSNTEISNFINCTIVGNTCNAASSGGGLRLVGTKNLLNNIVYGNLANGVSNDVNNGTGTMTQVTNLVGVTTGTAVAWAFTSNPSMGALSTCSNGLYYQLPGSSALDAGTATGASLTAPAVDICGTVRTLNPDLGSKELPCISPTTPTLSASSTVNCGTVSTTLSISTGTLNSATAWKWYTGSCGGTLVGTGASIVVSPVITTTYYVRGEGGCVIPGSCGNITITVNTLSTAPTGITGTTTICSGSSTTLTIAGGSAGTGASVQWFTGSCGGTSAGTGNSITVSPATTTTYYVRYGGTCNNTTCVSATVTVNTLSIAPTGITGTTTICNGSSTTLTVAGGSAGSGATVQWFTGSCGGTSAGTGNSITVAPAATTTYFVRYGGTCNNTTCASATVTVTANTISTAPTGITGTTTICSGSGTTLTAAGGTLGTGATAQWFTGSCGGTSAGTGNSITVSPATTTTYFVRYGGTCNTTTCASATVTVNTLSITPTGITGSTTICSGSSTTLTVAGGSAGTGSTVQWFTGLCGGTSAGTGNSITVTPATTTTYYVRYGGTCNNTTCASATVTVNSLSTAPTGITGTTTICSGASTTLTVAGGSAGTGSTVQWFTGLCGGTSAGTGNSITVTPATTTTYYVRYGGTCNNTTCASATVTVNTLSTAPTGITGTTTICSGASTTLTVAGGSAGTGSTVQWFTGLCGGTSAGTGNSITVSPVTTTTYYVRYGGTCNNTTCASATVTVNTLSTAPTGITGTTTICSGASTTLTVAGGSAGTGSTVQWFTGSCGGTSAGTGNSITVSPAATTTYFVQYTGVCNTTTCATATVTVNTLSTAPTGITGTTTICSGASTTLTVAGGSAGSGATVQWFTGSCGGTSAGIGNSITVSPAATTTYFVQYTGACNTTTCASATVTVNTLSTAPSGITGTTTICSGSSTTLTVAGGSAGSGATVQWFTGSCGGTSAGIGNSITVSPATTTTYFVRYSGLCNTTTCASITLTVSIPSTAATAAVSNAVYSEICLGGNVTLTASGGSLGTGGNWVWYEGGCGTGASIGSGSIITITPVMTGTKQYFVRAEGACPPTSCQSVSVNAISANPLGTVAYSSSIADGCVGAPPAMFSVNAVPNCSYYRWTCNQPGVLFNGVPGPYETTVPNVNVSFSSLPTGGASGWSICVFGGNACRYTNTICTWVRAKLSLPAAINGSIIGCPGTIGQAYSSATIAGAVSYQWSSTGGMVITGNGSQSITVDFPAGFITGTLSVHGITACNYIGPTRTMTISRAPVIPGTLFGPSYPCPNASAVYNVAAVPGAVNYTWTTSVAGAVVTGTTNSCSILFPAAVPGGSTVSVTANSTCPFSSPVRSKSIASGLAGVPNTIVGLNIGLCGQTEVSYSITPVPLAVGYSWSSTCGTFVGPTNLSATSINWPANFGSCLLSVSATNNCGAGGARYLTITGAAAIPPVITGNSSPCAYAVESYSTSGTYGASSYIWTVPAGAIILGPINGPSIIVYWGTLSGTITVRSSNTCGNSGLRSFPCVISCRQGQVTCSASGLKAEVYPNPATEKATVKFTATTVAQYHLNMTDVIGRNVLSTEGTAIEGINVVDLNLNNFAEGVYMLSIMSGDNNEQIRVVVD